jgi:hypothetical protein
MSTRFQIARADTTDSHLEVANLLGSSLSGIGFSPTRSPLPDRFIYVGSEQEARNVTVVLDMNRGYVPGGPRMHLSIHVLDTSGSDSEIAKQVRAAIGECISERYSVNLMFHTYRNSPIDLGP